MHAIVVLILSALVGTELTSNVLFFFTVKPSVLILLSSYLTVS